MSPWEPELLDAFFLADELDADDARALVEGLEASALAPAPDLRGRLLQDATGEGRFERYVGKVAELMDLDAGGARALLDGIHRPESWESSPLPQVELYHLEGGPADAAAITGFVRMRAGAEFPEHEHLGDEAVLIVQGSLHDRVSGVVHRPGEVIRMAAGTAHDFEVRPGPDLVYLVVAHTGIRIGDEAYGPDHPDL